MFYRMDCVRQTLHIFRVRIFFYRPHPSFPGIQLTQCYSANNPGLRLQPNGVFNGLSNVCCHSHSCLRNFQFLPERLAEHCGLRQLVFSDQGPLYCPNPECSMPFCNTNSLRDVVVERMAQVRNWMACQSPSWHEVDLYTEFMGVTQIYYQVRHGIQQRLADGRPKRNVVNVMVFHPYHNAFRWHHFTYRYPPCPADGMHSLLTRVLRQAAVECTNSVLGQSGFHCRCGTQVTQGLAMGGPPRPPPPPAVPADYKPSSNKVSITLSLPEDSSTVPSTRNGCCGHCNRCGTPCNADGRLPLAVPDATEASLRPSVPTAQAIPDAMRDRCDSSDSSESLPRVLDDDESTDRETVEFVYYGPPSPSASPSKLFVFTDSESVSKSGSECESASVVSAAASSSRQSSIPSTLTSERTSVMPSDDGGDLPSLGYSSESGYQSGPGSCSSMAGNWDAESVASVGIESVSDLASVTSEDSVPAPKKIRVNKLSLSQKKKSKVMNSVSSLPVVPESDVALPKESQADQAACAQKCVGHGSSGSCKSCSNDNVVDNVEDDIADMPTFDMDSSFTEDLMAHLATSIDWDAPFSQCDNLDFLNNDNSGEFTASQLEAAISILSSSPMQEEIVLNECVPMNDAMCPNSPCSQLPEELRATLSQMATDIVSQNIPNVPHCTQSEDVSSGNKSPMSVMSTQFSISKLRAALSQLAEEVVAENNPQLSPAASPSLSSQSSDVSLSPTATRVVHETSSSSDNTEPSSPDVTFIDSPMPTPTKCNDNGSTAGSQSQLPTSPVKVAFESFSTGNTPSTTPKRAAKRPNAESYSTGTTPSTTPKKHKSN